MVSRHHGVVTDQPETSTEPAAPARRRLDAPEPTDPQRAGCLWLGAILGVIAGVFVTFMVMPHVLDWAFQPAKVSVGETFAHDGRVTTIRGVTTSTTLPSDAAGARRWLVTLELTGNRSWTIAPDTFKLRLESGEELKAAAIDDPGLPQTGDGGVRLPLGDPVTITLHYAAPDDSRPEKLLLRDPQAEFDLPPAANRD